MDDTHANPADELVSHIDQLVEKANHTKRPQLEEMRTLAIDAFNQIDRLHTLLAYSERDSRETYKTIRMLKESGMIDDEHYDNANSIVIDARGPLNRYTDVDVIKARNIESLNKGEQL